MTRGPSTRVEAEIGPCGTPPPLGTPEAASGCVVALCDAATSLDVPVVWRGRHPAEARTSLLATGRDGGEDVEL